MASSLYNTGLEKILNATVNLNASADVRVLALKSGYTFDPDHDVVNDLTPGSNELTVAGYARLTCTGEVITRDDTNNRVFFDLNDPAFAALTAGETIIALVFFIHTGSDATAQLIAYIDVVDTPTNGGTITLTVSANGLFYIAVA